MPLYTFGGTPADVITDTAGNVLPDYPLTIRVAGTGAPVTALYEADGTTPIGTLRTNPADSPTPGAVRPFKTEHPEIEYEHLAVGGSPVRWYQAGREMASGALEAAQLALTEAGDKLDKTDGGTVAGPVSFQAPTTFEAGITAPNLPDLAGARQFYVTGAVGNGIADDLAAIQAALDAATAAGGGTVIIPGGRTYGISAELVARSRTTVIAYGATIKAIANKGLIRNFQTGDEFAGYNGHRDILILGGTWDQNASDGVTGTATGLIDVMNFIHGRNITVRDATIRNVSSAHGVEFNAVDCGRVINCRFEGFRDNSGDSSRQFSEAVQIDLTKSGSSSIGLWDNTPARDIIVENCWFGPSDRLGPFGRAVGSHSTASGVYYDKIKVLGCTIEGTLREGVFGYAWRDVVIADNVISGTAESGIKVTTPSPTTAGYVLTPDRIIIRGNTVRNAAADAAISVAGFPTAQPTGVVIADNVASNPSSVGIRAEQCASPVISGNTVTGTGSTGIYVLHGQSGAITGNTTRNTQSNAINLTGHVAGAVTGNNVDTTATNYGIYLGPSSPENVASTDALISNNLITASVTAGIRLANNATKCTVTGNKVRKGSGSTGAGIGAHSSATGAVIAGNDFSGNSWSAAVAIQVTGAGAVLDWAGGTASPGHNRI